MKNMHQDDHLNHKYGKVSLVAQVGIVSAIFFLIFGIILNQLVTKIVAENFIAQTEKSTSEFLEKQVDSFLNPNDFEHRERSHDEIDHEHDVFTPFLDAITSDDVIIIKIWDNQSTIIHAHNTTDGTMNFDESNKRYPDDKNYKLAIEGSATTEIGRPNPIGNDNLEKFPKVLKIYIPVYLSGIETPVGVAEVYYKLDKLDENIANINRTILILTGGTFILLYGVLLVITKRASDTLIEQQKNIEIAHDREIDRANELVKLKDEFVFIVAHDLKTPITALTGYIEIINAEKDSVSDNIKKSLTAIAEAAERLGQLITDLLEIARSDSGTIKVEVKPVDISEIITATITTVTPLAQKRGVKITNNVPEKISVMGDSEKLSEVMENLLSNAVKFNRENGEITISHSESSGKINITVSDTGFGIPNEEQAKIFTKFFKYRGEETKDVPGTGLGLFLIKMLIGKMGGDITFKSESGKGTSFTYYLTKSA